VKDGRNCIQDVFHVKVAAPKPDPATFIGFNAKKDEKNLVTLAWITSAENELAYFAVQRSTDAKNFTQIAKVPGGPDSRQNKNYTFEDNESPTLPVNTQYYYRVAAMADDGRMLYTPIVKVSLFEIVLAAEPNLSLDVEIIPNPSSASQMQIRTVGQTTQVAELTLTDVSGRILDTRKMTIGQAPAPFLPGQLTTGIYFLKVSINGRSTVKKLAIQ